MHNIENGLTSQQVKDRIALGQVNVASHGSSRSLGSIARANLFTLFNAVVGGAFVLMLALGQFKDALFGVIVILNIAIGVIQELRTKVTLDRLSILSQSPSKVIRDGELQEIAPTQIVLGDLLSLRAGDSIAADASVLSTDGIQIDESLLTGESLEISKNNGDALLAGTSVMAGSAMAVVTGVGDSTMASKIASDARRFSLVASELRDSLNKVVRWISWILLPIVLLSFYGQLQDLGGWQQALADGTMPQALVGAVASLISLVPQGLVLLTSMALSLGAVRLARKNVLAQELAAVEGLARVDVVCFDKTGTLTDGNIAFDRATELVQNHDDAWRAALAAFASDPNANATASALKSEFSGAALHADKVIDFSSERKWSAIESGDKTYILGAADFVLVGNPEALELARLAAETGERVLALAVSTRKIVGDTLTTNLSPLALLHFTEQLRPDAKDTLAFFAKQGVGVFVISGDNPATVAHAAARVGMTDVGEPIDASLFRDNPAGLVEALTRGRVVGRVHPNQKQQLIEALQSQGHVVAMIGDGVNDCLALKQADLGIAMGSGAAATKAVANLVFLDGKFSTIPLVLAEGRRVVANVERVSRLFLTKTVWAFTISLSFGALLWSYPYLPRQLTAMDAYAIGIPAFLLALLPNDSLYKSGFLKRAVRFVLPAGVLAAAGVIALTALIRNDNTWIDDDAHTATMILLSMTSLWVLALHSTPINPPRVAIFTGMLALCAALFTVPWVGGFFGFVPLATSHLLVILAIGFAVNACVTVASKLLKTSR